jgi:hypothetical protein
MADGLHEQAVKTSIDTAIALPALSSPFWWGLFDGVTHAMLALGGLFLLYVRIRIALDERKSRRGHKRRVSDHA